MSSALVEQKKKGSKGNRPEDDTSPIPALGIELGTDSNLPFTTPFSPSSLGLNKNLNEQLVEVLKDEWDVQRPTVRQMIVMRRLDGHARALYRLLTLPIRAAMVNATFVAADSGEKEADFLKAVFETAPANGGMTNTFQRFMGQLLGALFEGFSAFEKVFWCPEEGPLEGKYTLKKLAYRPSDTVTFITDKNGGFKGIRQRTVRGGEVKDVFIESEYAFYFASQEDERKFYGVSFFESAFPHYDAKAKTYFTAHLAAQRAAVGTRIGTVPPNASLAAKTEFSRNLSNLALAQWMMLPEGFKVEVLREGGSFDFLSLINHHNHMMSESVLANFFDKDTGGGSGESGALVNFAQPGDDMFVLMLQAIMDDIANHINHFIVPQLVDYNFKGHKYPTFTWGKFSDAQKAAIANTFDKLATAGQSMTVTPEFMRALEKTEADEMGLDIDWDAVDEREAADKAQAAAMGGVGPDGLPLPGAGAMGPDGLPLPQAPLGPDGMPLSAPAPVSDAEMSSMNSLADVIGFMGDRADQIADARGLPEEDSSAPEPTPDQAGQATPTGQPLPVKRKKTPPKSTPAPGAVGLSGISEDMLDWANRMLEISGEEDDDDR